MFANFQIAVEDQAIDRVHRLGQTRPVEVLRFVIKVNYNAQIRNQLLIFVSRGLLKKRL